MIFIINFNLGGYQVFNSRALYQKLADKLFFRKITSYQQALKEVSGRLAAIIDLNKLAELIVETTKNTMGLNRAGMLLRNAKTTEFYIQKVVGFEEENGISLVQDNFLTEHLQKTKQPLVYEELKMMISDAGREEKQALEKLKSNMEKIEAVLCLPLIVKEKLEGIIVLGRKLSGDAYTKEDLELLETLANQTSVGIENARLYDQVKDFSKHLQEKVDEQTRDVKKLLEIKTDFLHIVSHQLRTPLTGIQGAIAMMAEAETPEERKSLIQDAETSIARLTSITNDMLDALEIEGGRLIIEYDPIDIEKMIEEIIQTLKPNYDKKGLYLKFIKPKQRPIRQVLVDPKYIQMVLTNLIDNAEKYTKKGGVEIILKQPDWKHIKIIVKDTGIGLDKDDKKKLFKKFSRGGLAGKMHVSGSGLGLFIAKGIIDRHHGKIEAESEGRNKGAEFIVTLPATAGGY
ncbi:MAG: GAF domain-containing sensor histidine kinase [bacterium]